MPCFKNIIFSIISLYFFYNGYSQTLIMNEVSNGISGSGQGTQEYVEFVVVSNTVSYSCNSQSPPCVDIRGWIFDDNSGYHGPSGIASGAIRFSQHSLWACLPIGTIILIYNDADPNPAIPANDLSMNDGNCRIIAPISNTALFEKNAATPGAASCSYPLTGWSAGGNWANTVLANSSDCARIVNLSGCEVFSVCYGTADNQNTVIYFPQPGTGTVYYFNGINPQLQANWSSGSATTMQTPGTPNNAANAAYIAQFNNGCMPITPIQVTASSVNASCSCNGSATVSASGSIGGYTYTWYNSVFNPIGQTTATANSLCAGVYNVIATSSIGCSDTTSVTITSSGNLLLNINTSPICIGQTATLSVSGANTYTWSTGEIGNSITVSPTTSTSYSVNGSGSACSGSVSTTVIVNPLPIITTNSPTICNNQNTSITVTTTPNSNVSYVWNGSIVSGQGTNSATINQVGNYMVAVTNTLTGCVNTASISVNQTNINAMFNSNLIFGTAPLSVNFINQSIGATNYNWNFGDNNNNTSIVSNPNHTYTGVGNYVVTLIATDPSGLCSSTATLTIEVIEHEDLEVPNVFTPNNDGFNDVFKINSKHINTIHCDIYNRWGLKIYSISSLDCFWDGNGYSDGTYFYILNATGLDHKTYHKEGFISLFR